MELEPESGDESSQVRRWVETPAVMEHLGVSRNTVSNYVRHGMPAHKIRGGRYLYDLMEIDEWIDSRCTTRRPGKGAA